MEFLNRPRQTLHLIHTRRAVSGIIRTNQITWDIHHFVQNGWFWPILASLRGFFLDALWRNYLNLVHFSFSRSGSIPLVFGVTIMVVSPRQTCFFISYDLKRYWKNCTGLTIHKNNWIHFNFVLSSWPNTMIYIYTRYILSNISRYGSWLHFY